MLSLFLDFRRDFDTVQHDTLFRKFKNFGIRGVALKRIGNYLSNRHKRAHGNELSSRKLKLKHGVPQESVLGPLLILIFVNYLPTITGCTKIIMYADDTKIFFSRPSSGVLQDRANLYLSKL